MTSVQAPCYSYPKFKGEVGLFEKRKEQTGEKRSIEHITRIYGNRILLNADQTELIDTV